MEKFILHWGEMGTRWGVNRTVAQIHALLYLSDDPIDAESIADTLGVARSNVSTSIKELQSWGLVKIVHVMGDRRDHFESLKDLWEITRVIINERKKREIDPTISVLRQCVLENNVDKRTDKAIKMRIEDTLLFMEMLNDWYEQMKDVPTPTITKLMKVGSKVTGFLKLSKK
jgi:DNA-binding transcriptional regulator GbsR (MarR family)